MMVQQLVVTGFIVDSIQKNGNKAKNRDNTDEGMSNFLNWSYAWPANRRILYNRASADLNGKAMEQGSCRNSMGCCTR